MRVVAAYRELYNVQGIHPVEPRDKAGSGQESEHQMRAEQAMARALTISREPHPFDPTREPQPPKTAVERSRGVEL